MKERNIIFLLETTIASSWRVYILRTLSSEKKLYCQVIVSLLTLLRKLPFDPSIVQRSCWLLLPLVDYWSFAQLVAEAVGRWEVKSDDIVETSRDSLVESGLLFHSWVECTIRYHDHDHDEIDSTFICHDSSMALSSVGDVICIAFLRSLLSSAHGEQKEEYRSHTYHNYLALDSIVEVKLVYW